MFERDLAAARLLAQHGVAPPSEEIDGFPAYPGARFVAQEDFPPCEGEVSGFSICDATVYTWITRDDGDAVRVWYHEDVSESGWSCIGGAGWYASERSLYEDTVCRNGDLQHRAVFDAAGTTTTIRLALDKQRQSPATFGG